LSLKEESMKSQKYTAEFKEEAVQQITQRGYSVREVADRLGVSTHGLYKWIQATQPAKAEALQCVLNDVVLEKNRLTLNIFELEEFHPGSKNHTEWLPGRNPLRNVFCLFGSSNMGEMRAVVLTESAASISDRCQLAVTLIMRAMDYLGGTR